MRDGHYNDGPKIPIPGAAGATIYAALQSLAMRPGEASVNISKRKVAGGGYVYVISNLPATADPGENERD